MQMQVLQWINKYLVCESAQPELVDFDFALVTLFLFGIELSVMYLLCHKYLHYA